MKFFQHKSTVFFLAALFSFVSFSCDRGDDHHTGPAKTAIITITAPTENGFVTANDSATVSGTIEAAHSLHGYTISIRRKTDNVEIFRRESHAHNPKLTFSHKWLVEPVTSPTDLELELVTDLDRGGNTASKKVNFQVRP